MNNKIKKFSDIEIVQYLNSVHPTLEMPVVKSQINSLNGYLKEINEELYKTFIANDDMLLDILKRYEHINELVKGLKIPKIENEDFHNDNVVRTDEHRELEKAFLRLKDDMSVYVTNERYLIIDEYLNNSKYLLIITSDLTFVGELIQGKRMYKLLHSFPNSLIDVKLDTGKLTMKVQHILFEFSAEINILKKIINVYEEISYSANHNYLDSSQSFQPLELDNSLIDYYMITEQFGKMLKYIKETHHCEKINLNLNVVKSRTFAQLKDLVALSETPSKLISAFAIEKFKFGLAEINKIQLLKDVISDIFNYFKCFVISLEKMYEKFEIEKHSLVVLFESLINIIFESVEKRIFNKFYEIKAVDVNIEFIKANLVFEGYDFTYMIEKLANKQKKFSDKRVEIAKEQISDLLEKYFN